MTRTQIAELVGSFGIPTALNHFPADQIRTIAPPYIVFDYPEDDDFKADNTNYLKVDAIDIDLYVETMDFALIDRIGAALSSAGLVYSRTDTWIDSEQLYQIAFSTEAVITQ